MVFWPVKPRAPYFEWAQRRDGDGDSNASDFGVAYSTFRVVWLCVAHARKSEP